MSGRLDTRSAKFTMLLLKRSRSGFKVRVGAAYCLHGSVHQSDHHASIRQAAPGRDFYGGNAFAGRTTTTVIGHGDLRFVNQNSCAVHEPPRPQASRNTSCNANSQCLACVNTRKARVIVQRTEIPMPIRICNRNAMQERQTRLKIKGCREMRAI
jgi:hypothetical protein